MDTTRTFIIFSTLLCVWAGPIAPQDKSILKLILDDNNACNFPPREVLMKPTKAPYVLSCNSKQIPDYSDLGVGLEGIQAYTDAAQDNDLLLCMGFYDLSLQLCKANAPVDALPADTKQFNRLFSDTTGDDSFCTSIQSYVDQHTSFSVTSDWLTVLNSNLKTENNCKSVCTSMKHGKLTVRPICKILLWGRHLLHEISTSQPIPQPRKLPTEQGEMSHEQLREGDIYVEQDDLEAKDAVITETEKSTSKAAIDISAAQKTEPSSTLVSGLKELSNLPVKEQPTSVEQSAVSSKVTTNVLPSSEASRVVVIEPKSDVSAKTTDVNEQVKKSEEVKTEHVASEASVSGGLLIKSSTTSTVSTSSAQQQEPAPVLDQKTHSEPDIAIQDQVTADNEQQYAEQPPEDPSATFQNIDQGEDDDDDDFDQQEINQQLPVRQGGIRKEILPEADLDSNLFRSSTFRDAEDSHFFAYFLTLALICIIAYLVFHNKNKILALVLEGRRGGASRGGRSSRRPSTSSYRKLDSNLEEAISSSAPRTNPHVIY